MLPISHMLSAVCVLPDLLGHLESNALVVHAISLLSRQAPCPRQRQLYTILVGANPLASCPARDSAGSAARHVLHVQSISAWAPSCIGPYSQACSAHGIVHFAGQIGLDPPTMQLVTGGLEAEFARLGF